LKKNRPFPWLITIISLVAIAAIVLQFAPSLGLLPAPPTPTARPTNTALSPTDTPEDCSLAAIQTTALEFNSYAREFDDVFAIVQNTPAQDLVPLITELQRVRRASEDFVVPDCMLSVKELQVGYMNTFIETVLNLYSFVAFNPDVTLETQPEEQVALVN
jgi:hypothetical protein